MRFGDLPKYDDYVVEQEKYKDAKKQIQKQNQNSAADYRKQLLKLVQAYDPKNVSKIDDVLAKWKGREEQLIAGLHKK